MYEKLKSDKEKRAETIQKEQLERFQRDKESAGAGTLEQIGRTVSLGVYQFSCDKI